ncbi:hypothetical protein B0J17DRAFT_225485 [Rhizoctonia solani]|nr:hypothetical protein B0J17DRAFT_225485 [Rhizoctonia solani]
MTTTYTPALSGVLFLFWRHICLESIHKELANQAIEIHFRCMLAITTDQDKPTRLIAEQLCEFSAVMPRDELTCFPNLTTREPFSRPTSHVWHLLIPGYIRP